MIGGCDMRKLALLVVLFLLSSCITAPEPAPAVPEPVPVVPESAPEAIAEPVPEPVSEPVPEVVVVPSPVPLAEPAYVGRTIEVSIDKMAFSNETITIKKGDTIVWTNNDVNAHTVTVTQGPAPDKFDSNLLRQGQTFSHTFDIPTTYYYKCSLHPVMRGKIIVEP